MTTDARTQWFESWARSLAENKSIVAHKESLRVGAVVAVEIRDACPCVRLDTGDVFVANPAGFIVFTAAEHGLYTSSLRMVAAAVSATALAANSSHVAFDRCVEIAILALRSQIAALRAGGPDA